MKSRNRYYITLLLVIVLAAYWVIRHRPAAADNIPLLNRTAAQLVYTHHARCRMACRHIDESEVKEILESGTVNERKSEPDARPDPKYALEGITHDGQHVRIVFAPEKNKVVVITCIDLDTDWPCDCQ